MMGQLMLTRGLCMGLKGCSNHLMVGVSNHVVQVLVLFTSMDNLAFGRRGLVHDLVVALIAKVEV